MKKYSLSVIVITKNEAHRIGNCLASVVDVADEIIVLDSGSSDETVEIVKKFTEKVFVTDWPGFGKQKQRALEKASCDWVLSLDADEELTEELKNEINLILSGKSEFNAYKMRWAEILLGKQLRYGSSSRYVFRLFKREEAAFTDWDVHEKVVLLKKGKIGVLKGRLNHYCVTDFDNLMRKYALYASLAAQRKFDTGAHGGGLVGATVRSLFLFFRNYIFRLGFLDGSPGFLMAVIQSQYTFNKYAGLWFHKQNSMK